jgi:hypothetical protein
MKYVIWLIANTLWFGFFAVAILFFDWTPWSLVVPIIFHWQLNDGAIK